MVFSSQLCGCMGDGAGCKDRMKRMFLQGYYKLYRPALSFSVSGVRVGSKSYGCVFVDQLLKMGAE